VSADPTPASTGDPLIDEARKRFQRCLEWESIARERFLNDLKFAHGDSDNGYQWPNAIRRARDVDTRPCLTMNVVRQHNLQITNEFKQNKSAVGIRAVGNGATAEAATLWEGVVRHIEYRSNAQAAYDTAAEFCVYGGIGWWRLHTDYVDENSFDQEVFIRRIEDPLTVYCDPDARERDKSDMNFAFVFDLVPRDEFEEAYPKLKNMASLSPLGVGSPDSDWVTRDHVRVCEYWRKVPRHDRLLSFMDPASGQRKLLRESLAPKEVVKGIIDDPLTRIRDVWEDVIEWKLIVGDEVVDETEWMGKYIPLVPVLGEETRIEGVLDRKGHTRAIKDAQRMFNYNASSQVEFVALQGKTPWVAPAQAIEEYETYWNTANTQNHAVLPYNHTNDDGAEIPAPQRTEPPSAAPAYEAGMQTAFNQMMMASGQWQNQMGMQGNERTGDAIAKRQDQGDTATFHFRDAYEAALLLTGKMIIDLVPKVYDTKRVLMLQADDGTDLEVEIDPTARQALQQRLAHNGQVIRRIFNPSVGQYDVISQPGKAFGSRREETVKAMTLILTQNPALTGVIGDLLLSAMDFKEAQEAAVRLKRMVPPMALGKGPTQAEQALQQQVAQLQAALAKSLERVAKDTVKLAGKDQMRDIDAYDSETRRMAALADMLPEEDEGVRSIIRQLVDEALQTSLVPILKANSSGLSAQSDDDAPPASPVANGASASNALGGSGEWYLSDPTRRLRTMRIGPLATQH
jgi:hypothetical protein